MTHLDKELETLKQDILAMWQMVELQITKARIGLREFDKDLAREVVATEKRVNAFELKIDRDCEHIFALFNPVAIDLRFVLAVLKINNNLERIGDIADGIAEFVIGLPMPFDKKLVEASRATEMYDHAQEMLVIAYNAFDKEDAILARKVFVMDEFLDEINAKINDVVTAYIKENQDNIEQALYLLSTIRKLERVGDQVKNIAEEIIFYIEAKVLKHYGKNKKKTK